MDELPIDYLDLIDSFILKIFDITQSYLYIMNIHPNHITTLSFLSGLLSCFLFYKNYYLSSGIVYFISYIFDSIDGRYARKYNMVTNFGDHYDHSTDIIVWIILFIIMISKIHKGRYVKLIIINQTFLC